MTDFERAVVTNADLWVPAHNGTETPFITRTRHRVLYCFNPAQRRHAYINCDTDIIIGDSPADMVAHGLLW